MCPTRALRIRGGDLIPRTSVVKRDIANLELYLTHRSALVDYATPLVGCRVGAEDVVQEAYLRLDRASASISPDPVARPLSYLFRIVRNLAIDWTRRRSQAQPMDPDALDRFAASVPTPEDEALHRERLRVVADALQELPDRTRTAFLMHRLDGATLQEVADHLGVSVGLAHHLVREAVIHCAERLEEQSSSTDRPRFHFGSRS